MEYVFVDEKMLDSYKRGTMEMEFTSMVLINIFSHWGLIDNAFQWVTHEKVHMEATSMSGHGKKCSLKEETHVFLYDVHLD